MKLNLFIIALGCITLVSCKDNNAEVLDNVEETEIQIDVIDDKHSGPVLDCDETLSAIEMKEIWEMMNAKTHHENNICFEGYVLSNETSGDSIQGSIAFNPILENEVNNPAVYCQFTGKNGASFLNYEVGDKIEIMGRLLTIDDPTKHNFMLVKCSLPLRNKDL